MRTRLPCFKGFQDVYKLTNATFKTMQEIGPRVQELDSGGATVIPVAGDPKYVVLKDDLGIEPTENVVPAVSFHASSKRPAMSQGYAGRS